VSCINKLHIHDHVSLYQIMRIQMRIKGGRREDAAAMELLGIPDLRGSVYYSKCSSFVCHSLNGNPEEIEVSIQC
jgi:hypothetical protein